MKKLLLSLSIPFLAVSASAIEPMVLEGEAITAISPNGVWAAGQIADGCVIIHNFETGDVWTYITDGAILNYYTGLANAISDIGVLIGTTRTDNAAYWENGKWRDLPGVDPKYISNTGSITPDGSVICGGLGTATFSLDSDDLLLSPAVWYRQADGTYSDPVMLPHPEFDLTGRVPQYITAVGISNDGKTIAGQIRDFTGFMMEPIIYRCDDNGNWTYKMLARDLLNPQGIVFPEWPGELSDEFLMPSQEWFMDQDQIDAFIEAFEEWDYSDDGPQYEDFMTPEQIEAYNKAMAEYLEVYNPWAEKYVDFMNAYYEYVWSGTAFYFNNVRISPDGKSYLTTAEMPDYSNHTIVIDIDTDTPKIYNSNQNILISCMTDDGSILGTLQAGGADTGTRISYIYPQGQDKAVPLHDYMREINPEIADWMEDNMIREVITGISNVGTFSTRDMMCSGIPIATPDMSVIVGSNTTLSWMDYDGPEFISFVYPTGIEAGVDEIATENQYKVNLIEGGSISLIGQFNSLDIYDLSGTKVYSVEQPAEIVNPGLTSGIYIISAIDETGNQHRMKAMLK